MSHSAEQQFICGEVARAGQGLDTVHPHLSEQQLSYGKWPWLGKVGRGGLDWGRAEAGHNSQLPLIACHICLSLGVKTPWHSEQH